MTKALLLGVLLAGVFHTGVLGGEATVTGTVLYEKVPVRNGRLSFQNITKEPVAGATIEVLKSDDTEVLGTGTSGADGRYSVKLTIAQETEVYVRALATGGNARVVTPHNETQYALAGSAFKLAPGGTPVKNMLARDADRNSGPFNLLAIIRQANTFLRGLEPGIVVPELKIRWAINFSEGSYFSDDGAYIAGDRTRDSDEFDSHVVLHEYGHFIARYFSRDDSVGFPHNVGDHLDPRVAWSEGWGTFFAAAVLNDPLYVDTRDVDGQASFQIDLRKHAPSEDHPGYWSEHTAGSTLWAIFGQGSDDQFNLNLGMAALWQTFRGDFRASAFADLVRFCEHFERISPGSGAQLERILNSRLVKYRAGQVPALAEPFPQPLALGVAVTGDANSQAVQKINGLKSSQFYTFTLPSPGDVQIKMNIVSSAAMAHADLDLLLLNGKGVELDSSTKLGGVNSSEKINATLEAGKYFVEVRSWTVNSAGDAKFNTANFNLVVTLANP